MLDDLRQIVENNTELWDYGLTIFFALFVLFVYRLYCKRDNNGKRTPVPSDTCFLHDHLNGCCFQADLDLKTIKKKRDFIRNDWMS